MGSYILQNFWDAVNRTFLTFSSLDEKQLTEFSGTFPAAGKNNWLKCSLALKLGEIT